ncbi:M15 family metallopeptidase [Enterovibrio sp. ZSDZ35]|uniref:M15 family metallopeptidase n=1 Tax=Enterovibrio qingdaonensis TaxID=2899818 RepID=A0ABT5QI03_9GAMM|nr:M15 family metallopeptidase [Enterovibrio sp. ZSDZ35]MDD1780484.1 M15 family metallopeptidase [Enterovibrio sp. ZSDZ35]
MSRKLSDLTSEFAQQAKDLINECNSLGVEMRPYFTLRTPQEQAALWRQSRSTEQIQSKLAALRDGGADYLASCIEQVGPQHGRHVTNAIPGYSWHQWGEAMDCFWLVNGKAEWSDRTKVNDVNGYRLYAETANRLGITAGGLWRSFKDWPHVQSRAESHPGKIYTLSDIDAAMRERFG